MGGCHTERVTTRRHGAVLAAAPILFAFVLLSAAPAAASQGSVPADVAAFAADPAGLRAQLDDLYGLDAAGEGIAFDDTTKAGGLSRVWDFTPDFAAGVADARPVQLSNTWATPITIADQPVGLAVIWINQGSARPELADFSADAGLATAVAAVPDKAALVRDPAAGAWFGFEQDQLTPLVAGDSGVEAPVAIADYQSTLTGRGDAAAGTGSRSVLGTAVAVIVVSVLIILAVLLVPVARRRAAAKSELQGDDDSPSIV